MPVTPLGNLQVMLPHTTEVGRMQNRMDQQVNIAQEFGNDKLQKDADNRQMQVNGRDDVDNPKIGNDEEKEKKRKQQKQRQKNLFAAAEEEKPEKLMDAIRGHHIDISL